MALQSRLFALMLALTALLAAADRKTRYVVLITADGLRWQEFFGGIDSGLMNQKSAGMEEARALRNRLWRETPEDRRKALMPWAWGTLAGRGVILGDPAKNSSVRVTNAYRVSYPGYSEILTGRAQDEVVRGNDPIRNPTPTVLEFVRERLSLPPSQVALFGSWDMFGLIGESRPGAVFVNSGYQPLPATLASPRLRELSALQFRALAPDATVRHDYVTFEMALEYMRAVQPRLVHIALGETDDWAHMKRYDRVLEMVSEFDRCLGELWDFVQSSPEYRDKTTIVIATDHGRGGTLQDWDGHGKDVPGADRIWTAFIGPDTPALGDAANTEPAFQRDLAPTILDLLGIDYRKYQGVQGRPISLASQKRD